MSKYRKLPVVIDAFRLGYDPIPDWLMDKVTNKECILKTNKEEYFPFEFDDELFAEVQTLEGTMRANNGDYVVRGVLGEVYPCKPDIFKQTYEAIE